MPKVAKKCSKGKRKTSGKTLYPFRTFYSHYIYEGVPHTKGKSGFEEEISLVLFSGPYALKENFLDRLKRILNDERDNLKGDPLKGATFASEENTVVSPSERFIPYWHVEIRHSRTRDGVQKFSREILALNVRPRQLRKLEKIPILARLLTALLDSLYEKRVEGLSRDNLHALFHKVTGKPD